MNASMVRVLVGVMAIGLLAGSAFALNMETVPVGNPGNAPDIQYSSPGYGSVGYTYRIGKYEVTAGQYCVFLNAVAMTDTHSLYNVNMADASTTGIHGCNVQRSGQPGNYTYSVSSDWANRPVNWVSWGDAVRFANWLHNGQPIGPQNASTTEDGAYYINGVTDETTLLTITRKPSARWAVPSEDEWYKAAYHKNDGVTGHYWFYPTSSDGAPSNLLGHPYNRFNNATFYAVAGWTIGPPYYRTEVGAHQWSASPYGTYDQAGNVWEMNEAVVLGAYHGVKGGAFNTGIIDNSMDASLRSRYMPPMETYDTGFRVVEIPLPEVSTFLINNGSASSVNRIVTLNNVSLYEPTEYLASESSEFADASWQTYSSAPAFTLSVGNGMKTVYFKVRKIAGESAVYNDTILLDEPVPKISVFTINNNAAATSVRTVLLNNSCANSPTQYMASESAIFTGATWKPYSISPTFNLSAGNGIKTVYFKTKNSYGESSVVSDTIVSQAACNRPMMDSNGDLHVDAIDFDAFSSCYNGPTNLVGVECLCLDSNSDQYVDAIDFDAFSACYNGPTNPPGCY